MAIWRSGGYGSGDYWRLLWAAAFYTRADYGYGYGAMATIRRVFRRLQRLTYPSSYQRIYQFRPRSVSRPRTRAMSSDDYQANQHIIYLPRNNAPRAGAVTGNSH